MRKLSQKPYSRIEYLSNRTVILCCVSKKRTHSEEIENIPSQAMTVSGRAVTITTPASMAVGMVLAIPEALLSFIEAEIQTHQIDIDPGAYAL